MWYTDTTQCPIIHGYSLSKYRMVRINHYKYQNWGIIDELQFIWLPVGQLFWSCFHERPILMTMCLNHDSVLHATPWIPDGEKLIFIVINWGWSPSSPFACAKTVGEYDVIMPVPRVRMISQINCADVTILSQKRPLVYNGGIYLSHLYLFQRISGFMTWKSALEIK